MTIEPSTQTNTNPVSGSNDDDARKAEEAYKPGELETDIDTPRARHHLEHDMQMLEEPSKADGSNKDGMHRPGYMFKQR
jgi:hypothetical protein